MRQLELIDFKSISVQILLEIDDFCRKNGIQYSIIAGTLLGAVRHKGFIPWDDDIDIIMPREDYDRFVRTYNHQGTPKYQLLNIENSNVDCYWSVVVDNSTICYFSEITHHGVWVDVFPYDIIPDDDKEFDRFIKKRNRLCKFGRLRHAPLSIKWKKNVSLFHKLMETCLYIPVCLLPARFFDRRVYKHLTSYNHTNGKRAILSPLIHVNFKPFPVACLDEYIDIEFEGHMVRAIKKYDMFLKAAYGDYMQLPPVSERVPKHTCVAYYLDK